MSRPRPWIRLVLFTATAVLLIFSALRVFEWAPSGTPISAARLQAWSQPVPTEHNAFAQFWFAGVDLPASQWAPRLAMDAEHYAMLAAKGQSWSAATVTRDDPSLTPWPLLDGEVACTFPEMECIAKARILDLPLRAELNRQTAALTAANALLDANTVIAPDPGYLALNLRQWPGSTALLNQIALNFAVGERETAEQSLCQHVATWRRLRSATPHASVRALANSVLGDAVALYAEMRAELADDAPVSADCRNAFRVMQADEWQLCTVAGGEWRMLTALMQAGNTRAATGSWSERASMLWQRAALQPGHASVRLGHYFEQTLCDAPVPGQPKPPLQCSLLERALNPDGCALISQASTLPQRLLASEVNLDWQIRILDIALGWSADADEAEREARIRAVLSAARLPPETLGFDLDRRSVGVELLGINPPRRWEIFLPGTYASNDPGPADVSP